MRYLAKLSVALALCVGSGVPAAWASDVQPGGGAVRPPSLRFDFAAESPLAMRAGPAESPAWSLPGAYASAMALYRVAMASGVRPPLVTPDRIYGEELAGPLQWTWSTPNGDVLSKTGRGMFRLSFAENGGSWFREMNCRMIQWPGGDLQAPMDCEDGTQRVMTIPSEGVVMIDDVAFQRVFAREPLPPEEEVVLPEGEAVAVE